jgi:hypothetical protein
MDTEFQTAVETVKAKANGMLLEGLEYIRGCLDNDDYHLVSHDDIRAYHLVCYKMRPLFVAPNE